MSERAKHTPGPLNVGPDHEVVTEANTLVATCWRTGADWERAANAALFAAAPDLLAACDDALADFDDAARPGSITLRSVNRMRAAILKARVQA